MTTVYWGRSVHLQNDPSWMSEFMAAGKENNVQVVGPHMPIPSILDRDIFKMAPPKGVRSYITNLLTELNLSSVLEFIFKAPKIDKESGVDKNGVIQSVFDLQQKNDYSSALVVSLFFLIRSDYCIADFHSMSLGNCVFEAAVAKAIGISVLTIGSNVLPFGLGALSDVIILPQNLAKQGLAFIK